MKPIFYTALAALVVGCGKDTTDATADSGGEVGGASKFASPVDTATTQGVLQ